MRQIQLANDYLSNLYYWMLWYLYTHFVPPPFVIPDREDHEEETINYAQEAPIFLLIAQSLPVSAFLFHDGIDPSVHNGL